MTTAYKELIDYYHGFEPFFRRHEQSDWSWFYLCGQLSNLERKTIEPMVLALLGDVSNAIRDLQRFMGQSKWDTTPFIVRVQALVAAWLGERDGVAIIDGSGFPKQGKHSIGVAHQYCGHRGRLQIARRACFWHMPAVSAIGCTKSLIPLANSKEWGIM
jgi:SRSO17 transposase